jgi:hypothetical protein
MSVTLPEQLRPILRNGVPALLATASASGEPNATIISQVYCVDDTHVGLSFQFFNKTTRNIRENPQASLCVLDLDGLADYVLQIRFERSETEGPVFDEMEMQIEAIASATGMSGIFKLRAADIYVVEGLEKVNFEG